LQLINSIIIIIIISLQNLSSSRSNIKTTALRNTHWDHLEYDAVPTGN
jgi:hypothetical protein